MQIKSMCFLSEISSLSFSLFRICNFAHRFFISETNNYDGGKIILKNAQFPCRAEI